MTVPAIVVGLELNALGVVRSLAAGGMPVLALETQPGQATCATRHARVRRVAGLDGPLLIEALLELRGEFAENPVLLLTRDAGVQTVSSRRKELEGYRFTLPDDTLTRKLLDKIQFQILAERLDFLVPRAARLNHESDFAALNKLRYPCILKPTIKNVEYFRRFAKTYQVTTPDEALALWDQIGDVIPGVIVQEWIEGEDSDVYFCLQYRPQSRQEVTSFVGRKLRQWPRLAGQTACCVPAPDEASKLTTITNDFFSALGVCGLCSMEYKRDRRDGRFYMVEPTIGRTDFQEEVATLNGVNIPLAAYRAELGQEPPEIRVTRPCGWRDPVGDASASAQGSVERTSVPLQDAYWRASDPLPFARLKLHLLKLNLQLLIRRFARLISNVRAARRI